MSKIVFSLLCILSFSHAFAANNQFYIKPHSNWVKEINYDKNFHLYNDNKEDGGTYLLIDFQQDVALQELYAHYVIRIDEETGIQNYGDIWVNYDPSYQQLAFHKLTIHRNNKELDRLKEKDFKVIQNETDLQAKIYSGKYSAGIFIEDLQVGDIIEYAYTIKGENPIFKDNFFASFSLEYTVPINKYFLQVSYPKERNINYKLIKTRQEPVQTEKNNRISLTWEQDNLEEVVLNSDYPNWYIAMGRVSFSEFSNWSDVLEWAKPLFPDVSIENTELGKKFNELIEKHSGKAEKINELIRFVQNEISYVGIEVNENSHKPHNPNEVFAKRFGDCKDKTYLLVTLLRNMGVEAFPAYVNSSLKHNINEYLPSPIVFNHVIVAIIEKDNIYFIDPTITNQRGNYTKRYNGDYRMALVLNKKYNKPVTMPITSEEKIVIHEKIEVIDTIKPVKYSITSSYCGGEADQMRSNFSKQTLKEMESSFVNFYSYLYPNMKFAEKLEYEDNEKDNILTVHENYEIDNFWSFDNSADVNDYVAAVSPTNVSYYLNDPDQRNRTMPFAIYHPIEIENHIEFIHNKKITLENASGEITNPSFNFSYDIKCKGNTVTFLYKYKSLKDNVSVDELNQYYNDIDQITDLTWYEFTYGGNSVYDENASPNWLMIVMSVFFTILLIIIASKIYKKDIEISQTTSIPIGGWLILVAIGLIITPLFQIYTLASAGFFNLSIWEFISATDSLGYDAMWITAFLLELFMTIFLLIYSALLILLMIQKRTTFPMHYISFRVVALVFMIADAALVASITSEYFETDESGVRDITRAVIGAMIWIPYMLKSQRVKETFVFRYKNNANEQTTYKAA